jgi:hypothetical protein
MSELNQLWLLCSHAIHDLLVASMQGYPALVPASLTHPLVDLLEVGQVLGPPDES